ncbi:MAG: M20/M25/M40 family metallo-hydrolase [Candidatus Thorarchaeota archaeon]
MRNLIEIPSLSGFEKNIAEFIYDYLIKMGVRYPIEIDKHNNVIVYFDYGKEKTVLVDAHEDEIGFVVTNVDRWGSISLQYVGGGDSTILSARHLNILTKKGVIPAIIDRKHSHLVWDEDVELTYSPDQADVDIGIRDREAILKLIEIGDPVVYQHNFRELMNNYYAGYGFDDKAGCFVMLKTIEHFMKSRVKPSVNYVFVFSAQEETSTKLIPVIRKINPDLIVELDVTFATDYGEVDVIEREVGRCELGKGIVLLRGQDLDDECCKLAVSVAKRKKIPYQIQTPTHGIYTSQAVSHETSNAKAMVFGVPLRNMHAPTEIIQFNDLITGARLVKSFLLSKKLKDII